MKRFVLALGCIAGLVGSTAASAGTVSILDTNFTDLPASASVKGAAKLTKSRGYSAYGFGGTFLRNDSGGKNAARTVVRLTDLPEHSGVDLDFLLAIIGSWDGPVAHFGGDRLHIKVDGKTVFSGLFSNGFRAHLLPVHGKLLKKKKMGFGRYRDAAYDMSTVSALSNIKHSGETLKIEFFASGKSWQGGRDESFAIDNLRVTLLDVPDEAGETPDDTTPVGGDDCPPPSPTPVPLPASAWAGLTLMGFLAARKFRKSRVR